MKQIQLDENAIKSLIGGNKLNINNEIELFPPNYQEYHLTHEQFLRLRTMIRDESFNDFIKLLK